MDEGFGYDFQYQSCRISVDNFVSALDSFANCKVMQSAKRFDEVTEDIEELIACYEIALRSPERRKTSAYNCLPVTVSRNWDMWVHFPQDFTYLAPVTVEASFGIPTCATEEVQISSQENFLPAYKIKKCKEELEDYLSNSLGGLSSPKMQSIGYEGDLKAGIVSYQQKALRVFNCRARRGRFCEGEWGR